MVLAVLLMAALTCAMGCKTNKHKKCNCPTWDHIEVPR